MPDPRLERGLGKQQPCYSWSRSVLVWNAEVTGEEGRKVERSREKKRKRPRPMSVCFALQGPCREVGVPGDALRARVAETLIPCWSPARPPRGPTGACPERRGRGGRGRERRKKG